MLRRRAIHAQCWADVTDSAGSDDEFAEEVGEDRLRTVLPAARECSAEAAVRAHPCSSRIVACGSPGLSMEALCGDNRAAPVLLACTSSNEAVRNRCTPEKIVCRDSTACGAGPSTGDCALVDHDETVRGETFSRGNPAIEATPVREISLGSRARSSGPLNPMAPDFVPTLSMFCPLVGTCVVDPAGRTTIEQATDNCKESCQSSACASLSVAADEMRVPPGVVPETSEEVWQHREQVRRRELAILEASVFNSNDRRHIGHLKELMLPVKPDPSDRSMSRRQWKKATNQWVKAMFSVVCSEHGASSSVASTEDIQECQSSTAVSTSCDGASDCSEATKSAGLNAGVMHSAVATN